MFRLLRFSIPLSTCEGHDDVLMCTPEGKRGVGEADHEHRALVESVAISAVSYINPDSRIFYSITTFVGGYGVYLHYTVVRSHAAVYLAARPS